MSYANPSAPEWRAGYRSSALQAELENLRDEITRLNTENDSLLRKLTEPRNRSKTNMVLYRKTRLWAAAAAVSSVGVMASVYGLAGVTGLLWSTLTLSTVGLISALVAIT